MTTRQASFLSRVLGKRRRRRSRPPATSRTLTPGGAAKNTKGVRRGKSPLRTALDRVTRSLTRNNRGVDSKKVVAVYRHGTCTVNHRSRQAAAKCRRTN